MYQALYRKWRPKTFADVVGQEHITETLQRQVAEGRLSHAYLFTGTRGTGKTTCAKILARAVNCEHPENGNPCNRCPSCLGIESGRLLDVVELDAAIMDGGGTDGLPRAGSVAALAGYRNPVDAARAVMEATPHLMLAGDGAARFERALEAVEGAWEIEEGGVAQTGGPLVLEKITA